jgi:predicted negative regulator of RcsB-dependent stress response
MHELSDFEQVERIKAGFRQYGIPVLIGLTLALLISAIVYFFHQKQAAKLIENATYYQKITTALQSSTMTLSEVNALAEPLFQRPGKGPYAQLAALQLAKQAVNTGQLTVAKDRLSWAMEHGANPQLAAIARVRLARVLCALHAPQEALLPLNNNKNKAYQALVDETKGDVFTQLGKPAQARASYLSAQKQFMAQAINSPTLAVKMNALN